MLLSGMMAAWAQSLKKVPGVGVSIYLDDRVVHSLREDPVEALRQAEQFSVEADHALCFTRHPKKKNAAASSKHGRTILQELEK